MKTLTYLSLSLYIFKTVFTEIVFQNLGNIGERFLWRKRLLLNNSHLNVNDSEKLKNTDSESDQKNTFPPPFSKFPIWILVQTIQF